MNRECPDMPCDAVFADDEWLSVWQVVKNERPPKTPPRPGVFVKLLAELGGYNNRPKEPSPDPQVLWMGRRRRIDFTISWLALEQLQPKVVYK